MKFKGRTVLVGVSLVAIVVGAAYIIGVEAGNMILGGKSAEFRHRRDARTGMVLETMENLAIGDTLPDHYFHDLDLNVVQLSDLVSGMSVISFIDPECGSCVDQSLLLKKTLGSDSDQMRFISISSTEIPLLKRYREEHGIQGLILYDDKGQFQQGLGVKEAPFNIFVNQSLMVLKVVVGPITKEEVESVVRQTADIK